MQKVAGLNPNPSLLPDVSMVTGQRMKWSFTAFYICDNNSALFVTQDKSFTYFPNPELFPLNREAPEVPYRFKPGGVIAVEVN